MIDHSTGKGWVAALRGFAEAAAPVPHCDLCSIAISPGHRHLLDIGSGQLSCVCHACTILFQSQRGGRYRLIPQHVQRVSDQGFSISDAQWDALLVPVDVAFFFSSTPQSRVVAMYPGPAGAAESLLDLAAWEDVKAANPMLCELEPDVEALLVNRTDGARDCYRVPIDRCFALVGALRSQWQGFSGGRAAREALRDFFTGLAEHADHADHADHAAAAASYHSALRQERPQ